MPAFTEENWTVLHHPDAEYTVVTREDQVPTIRVYGPDAPAIAQRIAVALSQRVYSDEAVAEARAANARYERLLRP